MNRRFLLLFIFFPNCVASVASPSRLSTTTCLYTHTYVYSTSGERERNSLVPNIGAFQQRDRALHIIRFRESNGHLECAQIGDENTRVVREVKQRVRENKIKIVRGWSKIVDSHIVDTYLLRICCCCCCGCYSPVSLLSAGIGESRACARLQKCAIC